MYIKVLNFSFSVVSLSFSKGSEESNQGIFTLKNVMNWLAAALYSFHLIGFCLFWGRYHSYAIFFWKIIFVSACVAAEAYCAKVSR